MKELFKRANKASVNIFRNSKSIKYLNTKEKNVS